MVTLLFGAAILSSVSMNGRTGDGLIGCLESVSSFFIFSAGFVSVFGSFTFASSFSSLCELDPALFKTNSDLVCAVSFS